MNRILGRENILNDFQLYTPVMYRAGDGSWHEDYLEAVKRTSGPLNWDPGAILSVLSFNYACGDRTLIKQIRRNPWLSRIGGNGEPELLTIPPHGRNYVTADIAAVRLEKLLCEEVARACYGYDQIYLFLSGGLDSRIVAGVVAKLAEEGKINAEITAVTWGLNNSRDVIYGREIAKLLCLNWVYLELGPQHLLENIEYAAQKASGLISPVHLHRMMWSTTVDNNALFLAGSYGDMVGRAVFSGSHVLEMKPHQARNRHNLMPRELYSQAVEMLSEDIEYLRNRGGYRPEYALCELEGHGHYTRSLLSQAMNIINSNCTIYQAFTDPSVYQYMWSIHPSFRTDKIYAKLLQRLHPRIINVPWSRTNKAVMGQTFGADHTSFPGFHKYSEWISNDAFMQIQKLVDPEWLETTGLFSSQSVRQLIEKVKNGNATQEDCALFAWLATIRQFARLLNDCGKSPIAPVLQSVGGSPSVFTKLHYDGRSTFKARLKKNMFIRSLDVYIKPVRKWFLRRRALRRYPPSVH